VPPQANFTKKRVLEQAFEIVRKEGAEALSARKIAQQLECSTRPVYSAFRSMQELQGAVIQKARVYAISYFLHPGHEGDSLFLQLGLRYLCFSQEEKALFDLLFIKGKMGNTFEKMGQPFEPLLSRMKLDPGLAELSEAGLKRLGVNMWIFTHGLIVLMYTDPPEDPEEYVLHYLSQMGKTLIEWEKNQARFHLPAATP